MSIIGMQRITLTSQQQKKCEEFALKSAESQRKIEFGNRETAPRSLHELARDNLIGKLAEGAFAVFLYTNFEIKVKLDFDIYPRGRWDTDDFNLNGKSVDIKGTREGGRWLLIELNKLEFRKKEGKLPAYFLFASTGWNREADKPTGVVELKGFACLNEVCHPEHIGKRNVAICEGIPNTQFLPAGSFIPYTRTRLQADNCARPAACLHTNWTHLIEATNAT